MPDTYSSYKELDQYEAEGRDYRIDMRGHDCSIVIFTPHGGGIEQGTTEIANAIAGNDYCFYSFSGIKRSGNKNLHITSSNFDEPRCLSMVNGSNSSVSIHGCKDSWSNGLPTVFVGGRDDSLGMSIIRNLRANNFNARMSPKALSGKSRNNITNKTRTGKGVQLELTKSLRKLFFSNLTSAGRENTANRFNNFVNAIRKSLAETFEEIEVVIHETITARVLKAYRSDVGKNYILVSPDIFRKTLGRRILIGNSIKSIKRGSLIGGIILLDLASRRELGVEVGSIIEIPLA